MGRSPGHLQSSGDELQHQQKEATLGELKRQQKNSVKSVATSKNVNCLGRCHDAEEDRPPLSKKNNERESPDRAKANKKYSNTANISQKERGSRGPSNVGRPLPITQGLSLIKTQETKKARFPPLLATGLAPHQLKMIIWTTRSKPNQYPGNQVAQLQVQAQPPYNNKMTDPVALVYQTLHCRVHPIPNQEKRKNLKMKIARRQQATCSQGQPHRGPISVVQVRCSAYQK